VIFINTLSKYLLFLRVLVYYQHRQSEPGIIILVNVVLKKIPDLKSFIEIIMKLKFAVAVVALSSAAGFANAGDYTFDISAPSYSDSTAISHATGTSFVDNFSFSLTALASALGSSATNQRPTTESAFLFGTPAGSVFDINNMMVSLYQGALGSGVFLGSSAAPGTNIASYSQNSLGAGNYYFSVGGNTSGTAKQGLYTFAIDVAPSEATPPSPVPEPETYAMMLAGLGLLGFAARRKAKADKS
jgi:hypothetical protein